MSPEQLHDLKVAAAQTAPSGVTAVTAQVAEAGERLVFGLKLSEWSVILMMVFVLLQIGYLLWKWRRDVRREDERKAAGQVCETGPGDL